MLGVFVIKVFFFVRIIGFDVIEFFCKIIEKEFFCLEEDVFFIGIKNWIFFFGGY